MKKKYCIVGLGSRGIGMFLIPLVRDYADVAEVTGLCDINWRRLEVAKQRAGIDVPTFTDFDEMLRSVECDAVIVATKDSTHHHFIIKALEAGKDAITEKPMTVDDEKCRAILAAEAKSSGTVRVTFNYRFAPYMTRVKELLKEGVIGRVLSVDFAWYLDTIHGADYYRRWHRRKENSGGLFVHKATHHFDLINWWLDQEPVRVYASGSRNFYGPTREERGERCLTCQYKETCEFYVDLGASEEGRSLYLEAESVDGYWRDGCVFSPEIDIEDTMGAIVNYSGGAQLNYSLHSFMPFEGWRVAFNGTKGRLEAGIAERYFIEERPRFSERAKVGRRVDPWRAAQGDIEVKSEEEIRIYPLFGGVKTIKVPHGGSGHGGGDVRLRDMLFRGGVPDPLNHLAGSRAGAMSILTGVAANRSMALGRPVMIEELLQDETAQVGA